MHKNKTHPAMYLNKYAPVRNGTLFQYSIATCEYDACMRKIAHFYLPLLSLDVRVDMFCYLAYVLAICST